MAHKSKKGDNAINKTYIFKVKCGKGDITSLWKPAMEEYCTYYNRVSKWICDNLTTMTIGDLAQYIENTDSVYYKAVTDEKCKELPLYKIFKKGVITATNADNALFEAIKKTNVDLYVGNMLGLRPTSYRRQGYVANVIGNYRTKMSDNTSVGNLQWKKMESGCTDEQLLSSQCIVDVVKYRIGGCKDFEDIIANLKSRDESQKLLDKISRLELLYAYYSNHEDEIKARIETLEVENLKRFGGCVRRSMDTCTINVQNFQMESVGNTDYIITLPFNGKSCKIVLMGNRQTVRYTNGNRTELTDIVGNHGDQITFKLNRNGLFAHMTSSVGFTKTQSEINNVVGGDINIKHNLIATSIADDGNVKGYINLYKVLVDDDEFAANCTNDELEQYRQMSESVNFGIFETDSLFERFAEQHNSVSLDQKALGREKAMQKVFGDISKTNSDIHIVNYVNAVKMMRAKYKAYFTLKEKYYEKQKEYDIAMGFTDESTESAETMDARRRDHPFIETDTAKGLLAKLDSVSQDLIGCRDNIVTYAFNVFKANGYDTIALEYLESSQFDKRRMPTPKSLLKYHKLEGKPEGEVTRLVAEKKFNPELYEFQYANNLLSDIQLSPLGVKRQQKLNFGNLAAKAVRFADIKDKFAQLANNNQMNVVFVPSAFTSQMDSLTHTLYFVERDDPKAKGAKRQVLASKWHVRTKQERHINGLNADYNAARNIAYIASDIRFREEMTESTLKGKNPSMYGKPCLTVKSKFKKNVSIATQASLMKLGQCRVGRIENGVFTETA